jgi:hypothetical protein
LYKKNKSPIQNADLIAEILPLLQKMEERQYENAFEVTKVAGLVRYHR